MKRFSNSSTSIIIAAISIALLGLSWAQIRLVNNSIELSDQLFSQQVREALSNVSRKLEDVEHVADAVMISAKQHELQQQATEPRHQKHQVHKKDEKKTDSVMACGPETPNTNGLSSPPASMFVHTMEPSSRRARQSMLRPPLQSDGGNRKLRSTQSSEKVLTNPSTSQNVQLDIRQNTSGMELNVSSDPVSTSSTADHGTQMQNGSLANRARVRSWDSVIKQLSGNLSVRYFEVEDNLHQTILQLKNEQFVLQQSPQASSLRNNQGGIQTSVGFLVDGNNNISALPDQNSTYMVAVGEPAKMQHNRPNVLPVLHKKELCANKNCGVCNGVKATDSNLSHTNDQLSSIECTQRIQNKINLIQQTVNDLREFSVALEQRVNQMMIDSMIASEFSTKNLPMDYGFGVMNGENSHFVYAKNAEPSELAASPYKSVLFSGDIVPKNHKLFVSFPTKQSYIFRKNAGILSFSALFMVMIIGSFGWTMRNLNRHKKVSEMKSDFINNMTHEFKTPIATIALAADALRDPQVRSSGERVGRFIGVIREENQRLGSQVERVLQAAKLDRGELALSRSDVDVHELIGLTKDSITLQVDARGGIITTDLRAEYPIVFGDEMHLRNVMLNLLDNANKYTAEKPVINITTRNINNGVMISVSDNGIGINRESQKRIFEKLYRVPTGNVHNVKGFGLGLSYVKAIVEVHGGFVNVESEIGRGSRFDVFLPFGIAS